MKVQISQTFLFFFLLHLTLLPISRCLNNKQDDLLHKTCKLTNHYNLCLSTLNSNPKSKNATNVQGLAQITLELALTEANNTLWFVGGLFSKTSDPMLFRLFGTCIEEYKDAVTSHIPQAIHALNSSNYGASKQGLIDAVGDVKTCNVQLVDESPVMTRRNNFVHRLLDAGSQIVSLLS